MNVKSIRVGGVKTDSKYFKDIEKRLSYIEDNKMGVLIDQIVRTRPGVDLVEDSKSVHSGFIYGPATDEEMSAATDEYILVSEYLMDSNRVVYLTELDDADITKITSCDLYVNDSTIDLTKFKSVVNLRIDSLCRNALKLKVVGVDGVDDGTTLVVGVPFDTSTVLKNLETGNRIYELPPAGFRNCSSLENIDLLSVVEISDKCFKDCTKLSFIYTPSVTRLGIGSFQNCSSLSNVDFSMLTSFKGDTFNGCTGLKSIYVPCLTKIGDYDCLHCSNLNNFYAPLLTSIGQQSFASCGSLKRIDFPLVAEIDDSGLYACAELVSVDFPRLLAAGGKAFYGCSKLINAQMNNLEVIPTDAFRGCGMLSTVGVSSANAIGAKAFYGCVSLLELALPSITETSAIAVDCFLGCPAAMRITVSSEGAKTKINNSIGANTFEIVVV